MSGVLDALASQIGASVEATIFLLSLFIGKANLCLCQNRCHETNRISYVIIHYAVLQCSCVFLKLKLGPVCNRQNFKFLYYCMNIVRTVMNLHKSNIFCFYLINYWNEIFFIGYPLGFFHRAFIHGNDENIHHVFFTATGLAVYYFNFGKLFLHDAF